MLHQQWLSVGALGPGLLHQQRLSVETPGPGLLQVSIVVDQLLRLLHHCGMPKEDVDCLHGKGPAMGQVRLPACRPRRLLPCRACSDDAEWCPPVVLACERPHGSLPCPGPGAGDGGGAAAQHAVHGQPAGS